MKKTHDMVFPSVANFMTNPTGTCSQCGETGGFDMEGQTCSVYKPAKPKKTKVKNTKLNKFFK